jgi:hypothetical protein
MKIKTALFTFLLLVLMAVRLPAATINETIASLNAGAKIDGPAKVLQSISASTHVPVATLEKQKARTNLSYGDLFVAHAIARATGKRFDEIAALKLKGQSWDKIAQDNHVSLGGNKKEVARSGPKPGVPPSLQVEQPRSMSPTDISSPFGMRSPP